MLGVAVAMLAVLLVTVWTVESRVSGPGVAAWQPAGLRGQFVHSLALSEDRNVMLAGTESGVYVKARSGSWRLTLPRREIWSVAASSDGQIALAANNAGNVDISHDGGRRWRQVPLTSGGVYVVSFRPGHSAWMLAAGGGGVFLSRNWGRTWRQVSKIGGNAVDSVAWLPGGTRTAYAGVVSGGTSGVSSVLVTHNGGQTWTPFDRGLTKSGAMSVLATPHSILAGTMGHAVWRISRARDRWGQVRQGLPATGDHVAALIGIASGRTLFAGTEGLGVFVSSDDGRTWKPRSDGLPATAGQKIVLGLAYARVRHVLYAGTPSGIYSLRIR
jgi:hypothetical protein